MEDKPLSKEEQCWSIPEGGGGLLPSSAATSSTIMRLPVVRSAVTDHFLSLSTGRPDMVLLNVSSSADGQSRKIWAINVLLNPLGRRNVEARANLRMAAIANKGLQRGEDPGVQNARCIALYENGARSIKTPRCGERMSLSPPLTTATVAGVLGLL